MDLRPVAGDAKPVGPTPTASARAPVAAGPAAAAALPTGDALTIAAPEAAARRAPALGWVRAQGDRLVDAAGRTVPVRAVNLGGWLVQEPWMMPLATKPAGAAPVKDQATMWGAVEARFGAQALRELRDAYRDAWLTEADFARMKAAGLTAVRLPFTAATLAEPGGFERLDWAIDAAARHGLHTILDLHGAPGGQSKEMHTGAEGEPRFFTDPANVKAAADLWREVARRYADRPEVLGFDLLNEPMGAKTAREVMAAQDALYRAIREVDDRHVVFFEDGYKGLDTFPRPEERGWRNVGYSVHQYAFGAKTPADHLAALDRTLAQVDRVRQARNVPVLVGEFNVPGEGGATLAKAMDRLERSGVPWSMWTYKVVTTHDSATNVWGLYRNEKGAKALDVRHDSLAELRAKIGQLRTERLAVAPDTLAALKAAADAGSQEPPPARTGLARWWLLARDRAATAWAGLVDRVKGWW